MKMKKNKSKGISAGFDYGQVTKKDGTPDDAARAKLIKHQQQYLIVLRKVNVSCVLCGVELEQAQQILAGTGRDGLFRPWVRLECGISTASAYNYIQMGRAFGHLTKERDNTLKLFTLPALLALSHPMVPDAARYGAIALARKAEAVTKRVASDLIAEHTIGEDGVPGLAADIAKVVSSRKLKATPGELIELAQYDVASQRSLVANVQEGRQTLAEAVETGLVVEPTLEQKMESHNKAIDSVSRQIMALAKAFDSPWIDKNTLESIVASLRTAAATARMGKGVGECPKCKSAGCKTCRQTGFLPKIEMEMSGG